MEIFTSLPIENLLLSLGLGCFLGIRRELNQKNSEKKGFMGVRTSILFAVLGTVSVLFPTLPQLPLFTFGALTLFVAISYAHDVVTFKHKGLTREISALIIFWIGVLAGIGQSTLAILLTILLGIMGEFKTSIHNFVYTLTEQEVKGALQLLVFSGAVLPFLPQTAIDPWGIFVPFKIWLLVILISGLGFLGYFLTKYLSSKGGVLLSSFLGALVSSTAVCASLAEQSVRSRKLNLLASGIFLALGTMQIRVLIEILAVGGSNFQNWFLLVPTGMALGSFGFAWMFFRGMKDSKPNKKPELSSPFELLPALKFGLLFVVVLLALHFAKKFLGNQGVYAAAALSGLVDVDAIVLSSVESANNGELTQPVSEIAIFLALFVNTLVKIFYASLIGSKSFVKKLIIPTVLVSLIGAGLLELSVFL
ncbi:hypothetical protein CSB37_01200 [bacterium DOLZORAL124_38_8]|nr:MAG: hypothetical protein CSB37_01200 [bacterium DOLZORAL124_38_8]